jgi:hypothetical protein
MLPYHALNVIVTFPPAQRARKLSEESAWRGNRRIRMTPGKKRVLGGESDSGEFWNPWTSPVEALELLHYMDKEDARGEPPSKQELSDFHAWLDKGASVRLSDHRIAQLYLRYLDDSLGPAASSVGKILRISEGQAPALRELEKQADSVIIGLRSFALKDSFP